MARQKSGPGRDVSAPGKPTQLPARSWAGVLKRTLKEFKADNLTDKAAALTYYGLLSIFPALLAVVSRGNSPDEPGHRFADRPAAAGREQDGEEYVTQHRKHDHSAGGQQQRGDHRLAARTQLPGRPRGPQAGWPLPPAPIPSPDEPASTRPGRAAFPGCCSWPPPASWLTTRPRAGLPRRAAVVPYRPQRWGRVHRKQSKRGPSLAMPVAREQAQAHTFRAAGPRSAKAGNI